MSRRRRAERRKVAPDPRFGSEELGRFINRVMIGGKKTTAQRIVYTALDKLESDEHRPGLDVFELEPLAKDHPLLGLSNVVFSPHMAGSSSEGTGRSVKYAYDNVRRVLSGNPPLSLVSRDRSNVGSGPQSVLHRS